MSKSLNERFTDLADIISEGMGRWWVTALALLLVIIWAATGPFVGYSDSWQLWVNTPTTIAELFIGFLIAAAANRVERRHDVLLETIQQQAEASVKVSQRDVAVSHKHEEDLNEIKESLTRLELNLNLWKKKEGTE